MTHNAETDISIQRETTSWLRSRLNYTDCEAEAAEIVAEILRRSRLTKSCSYCGSNLQNGVTCGPCGMEARARMKRKLQQD